MSQVRTTYEIVNASGSPWGLLVCDHASNDRPYHTAIGDRLDAPRRARAVPALIAVHSFTPRMDGFNRPRHVGVLRDRDDRNAAPLHAAWAGLPHAGIEVRQDLISDAAGVVTWIDILRDALAPIMSGLARSAA